MPAIPGSALCGPDERTEQDTLATKPNRTSRIARLAGLAIAVAGMAFATASWASITSSENPSTDGSYTVSWSWVPNAHQYQLYEDGRLVYDSTGTSWSFSGKAAGDYEYTVGFCEFIFDEEMCYESVYTALTVTVSSAPPPTPAPTVSASFDESSITLAESVTLTWSSRNASRCGGSPSIGSTATSGTKRYTPSSAGRFEVTVTCTGAGGSADDSASVTVNAAPPPPPPLEVRAWFDQNSITLGESVTLSWSSRNASRCGGSPSIGSTATSGTKRYTPSSAGRFEVTVTCTGAGGSADDSASVTVNAPPPTVSASFDESSITLGADATLRWSSTDATSCSGTPSIGSTATSGSKDYTPSSTGSFSVRVTCTGAGGSADDSASVTVNAAPPPPPPLEVRAWFDQNSITLGESVTLSWSSTNATSCSGTPSIGSTATSGSKDYTPSSAGRFEVTVTCTGAGGSADDSASVTVNAAAPPPPPLEVRAWFDQNSITLGESVTLSWSSTNATSCSGTPSIGSTATSGSKDYTPSSTGSFSVRVTCTGAGGSLSDSDSVTVNAPRPTVRAWFDKSSMTLGDSVTLTWSSRNASRCGGSPSIGSTVTSGTKRYTPSSAGRFDVTVTCTGAGGSADAEASVTVNDPPNTPPEANDDTARTPFETAVVIAVLANDTDADNDVLTVTEVTAPASGTARITSNSTRVTYTPDSGHSGADAFDYTVSDGAASATASVRVTVDPPTNTRPVARDDTAETPFGTAVVIAVLANDTDADNDVLTVTEVTAPASGTARITSNNTRVTYTPDSGHPGADTFDYTVSDGAASDTGTVSVTVDLVTVTPNPSTTGSYTLSWDGSPLLADSYRVLESAAGGTPSLSYHLGTSAQYGGKASGNYYYLVERCETPLGELEECVELGRATATVELPPPPPEVIASFDRSSITLGDSVELTWSSRNASQCSGTPPIDSMATSGMKTYTPSSSGSFEVTVTCEGAGGSDSASASATVNTPPEANDDTARTAFDTAAVIAVLANDTDADGDVLTVTTVTMPANGAAEITSDANGDDTRVTYTPRSMYSGADAFRYTVSDGTDTASAGVSVTINTPPDAMDDAARTAFETAKAIEVVANDMDADGDDLTVTAVTMPANGAAEITSDANGDDTRVTYTPRSMYSGADAFRYTVSDGTDTASAGVSVTINTPPDAVDDAARTAFETAKAIEVLANDSDADGDDLTVTAVTTPANGAADITSDANGNNTRVLYTPRSGYSGADTFDYTVSDGTDTASASVRVAVNTPPVAVDDTARTAVGTAVEIDVLDNDTDAENDVLTVTEVTAPTSGTATITSDAHGNDTRVTYTPQSGHPGADTFDYTVSDGAATDTASVSVTVTDSNTPPAVPRLTVPPTDADGDYRVWWTDSAGATLYELEEKPAGGTFAKIYRGPEPCKEIENKADGAYSYRVRACNSLCSDWSPTKSVRVERPPAIPTLTVPATDADGTYPVSWTTSPGTTSYKLEEKPAGGTFENIYKGKAASKTIEDRADGTYSYWVQACSSVCSDWSETESVTVERPPAAPELTVPATDADGDYTVWWTSPAGAKSYRLREKRVGGTFTKAYDGRETSKAIRNKADGRYRYRVRACNSACGRWSLTESVTVERPLDPTNNSPVAVDDTAETPFGTAKVIDLLANDTDADDDDLTVTAVTAPARGTVTITSDDDGNDTLVTYTPRFDNPGADAFDYTVSDGEASDTGSVAVTVNLVTVTPNPSTTGIYTLSWSVTLADRFKVSESTDGGLTFSSSYYSTISVQYSGKAAGEYIYVVESCETPLGEHEVCSHYGRATATVVLPPEPTIETGALVAPGNLPHSAGVTKGGDAYVTVPIEPAPGVNGFVPRLAINYGGGRERQRDTESLPGDTLGYGWHLSGFSTVRRCVKHQEGNAAVRMTNADSLCLDGEPLVLRSGTHFAENAEYRTLRESYRKIVLKGSGADIWFEVTGPDGTVSEYGRTADSRLRNVEYVDVDGALEPVFTGPFLWSVNKQTGAFGNTIIYAYHEDEVAGARYPREIRYGDDGDARLLFEYVIRSDLAAVSLSSVAQETKVLLHTVRAVLDAHSVRTYRMKSETANGRRQLDLVQVCGFDEDSGTSYQCLRPLDIDWEAPPMSLPVDKVLLARITDPLGRETAFDYGTLTTGNTHAFLFPERPFGNAATPADAAEATTGTGTAIRAVVTAVRRSNGIGGEHTMSYAYQGKGYDSERNWGFLGFPATRVTDAASGIVTYYQYRLDFPYYADVAAVRQYDGPYDAVSGSADTFDEKLLFRQELAYAKESLSHASVLPYIEKAVEFHYEGGEAIGLTQTESTLTLSGGLPTQLAQTTKVAHGETHSGGGTPWGAPPTYALSDEQRKATTTTKFTNRTTGGKWLIGFANEIRRSDFAGGSSSATRERRTTFAHHSTSNRVDTMERFPADPDATPPTLADAEHYLRTAYAYDTRGNHFSTTVSGANVTSRTSRALFDADEARYPRALRNALGQEHGLVHDKRFGLVKRATDPNSRATILAYDPFGREKSRTTPDQVLIKTSYQWCSDDAEEMACDAATVSTETSCDSVGTVEPVARVCASSAIQPTETRYLDKLGRVIRTEVESFDGASERREDVVYDARGRVDRASQPYHTGDRVHYTDYDYDIRDRVTRVERPDDGDTAIVYAVNPDQSEPDRDHQVRVTVTEEVYKDSMLAATHIKRSLYNVLGELIETTDGAGSAASAKDHVVTTYTYDGSGLLKTATVTGDTTTDPSGTTSTVTNATTFNYDVAGARDNVVNPNFGTVTFTHTALGELRTQVDSEGTATYSYDRLGRPTKKVDPDGVAQWSYDPANAIGALGSRCYHASACAGLAQPNFKETLAYDSDARLRTSTINIRAGGHVKDYVHSYTYDPNGRPATVEYPSGLTVRTDYNARGYRSGLTDVTDSENPAALETFDAMNAYGQIRQQTYGNGVVTAREFDAKSGRLTDIDTTRGTTKIQDNTYAWRTNGILASRLDESGATAKEETFGYDALDRLKSATTQLGDLSETMNPAERTLSYAYDKLGNLTGRTSTVTGDRGIGGTSFGDGTAAPGPNALTGATIGADAYALAHDAGGKVTRYDRTATGDDTFIGWNARGLVETVVVGDSADDADPTTKETFAYGPDGRRYHRESVWKDGGVSRTDHAFYAGAVEERLLDGHAGYASVQRTRVGGGIVQVRTLSHPDAENKGEQTAESNLEYLHRDHLGSIEAVTNASGAELLTLAYDPFGARRKADWTRSLNPAEIDTLADDLRTKVSRGYSDHEHLDRAGFVHMNGRVYDPRTGRFLSPDPIVEDPAFSQSWHSYSYVANSPLSLVDPTGLSFAPCPLSNPVNMGGYCAPASSPGVFGGKIQTIISNIHRVRFEVFVYDTLVFGTAGDIPGEHEYVFDVLSVIRVLVSVESETVERQVPVDDQNEADEPLDAQVSEEGWYRRLLGKRYERMLAQLRGRLTARRECE